jgi:hypothetical protein
MLFAGKCPHLDQLARRPHFIGMKIDEVMRALEGAWAHALPGHQTAERDAVLRELHRLLQQQPAVDRSRGRPVVMAPRRSAILSSSESRPGGKRGSNEAT